MLGIFAEFERSMIQERVKAGLARARAESPAVREAKGKKAIGRPQLSLKKRNAIMKARADGLSIRKIAQSVEVSTATVQKMLNG